MFPVIEHIDQVKEAIVGRDEFIIAERDGYQVVNYLVNFEDTFPNPYEDISEQEKNLRLLRRECRGITFDSKGKIICRKFNKFFNWGEKPNEQHLFDFNKPFLTLEKADGSMIAPMMLGGKIHFTTKMGTTSVAELTHPFLERNPNYIDFSSDLIKKGYTPLFEFTSPKQRIVISYPEDNLILLAIRNIYTGEYVPYEKMLSLASEYDIDVIKAYGGFTDINQITNHAVDLEDIEGFVVRMENGLQTKIKADLYLKLHRTLDGLSSEKNAIRLILEDRLDDAKPLLADYIIKGVDKFSDDMNHHIMEVSEEIYLVSQIYREKGITKKEFATQVILNDPDRKKYGFAYFDAFEWGLSKEDIRKKIVKQVIFSAGNKSRMDENRFLINNIRWEDYLNINVETD